MQSTGRSREARSDSDTIQRRLHGSTSTAGPIAVANAYRALIAAEATVEEARCHAETAREALDAALAALGWHRRPVVAEGAYYADPARPDELATLDTVLRTMGVSSAGGSQVQQHIEGAA